jgi:hypothetical protein
MKNKGTLFKSFIPGLPSKDVLVIILQYAFNPTERANYYRLAISLCKKSIQLLTHPSIIPLLFPVTPQRVEIVLS